MWHTIVLSAVCIAILAVLYAVNRWYWRNATAADVDEDHEELQVW